jgi:hypothetical protein
MAWFTILMQCVPSVISVHIVARVWSNNDLVPRKNVIHVNGPLSCSLPTLELEEHLKSGAKPHECLTKINNLPEPVGLSPSRKNRMRIFENSVLWTILVRWRQEVT